MEPISKPFSSASLKLIRSWDHARAKMKLPSQALHSQGPEHIFDLPPEDEEDDTSEDGDEGSMTDKCEGELGWENYQTSYHQAEDAYTKY